MPYTHFTTENYLVAGSVSGLSCPSLDQYLLQHPECRRFVQQDEWSVFCPVEGGSITLSLTDCVDPVSVNVEANVPSFDIDIAHVFNRTETVGGEHSAPITAVLERNTSHLALEVISYEAKHGDCIPCDVTCTHQPFGHRRTLPTLSITHCVCVCWSGS